MPDDAGHPADPDATPETQRRQWDADKTTRDRVYEVAIQLHEPASAADVAERANCSTDAARDHLDWLAGVGVVERNDGRPTAYRRNESYFEWRRVEELRREHGSGALLSRLESLTAEERAYRERFDAAHPDDVDALDVADHDAVHEVWRDLGEWRTVRREIRLLERARRETDRGTERSAHVDG